MNEHDEAARVLALSESDLLTELGVILSGQTTRDGADLNAQKNGSNWFTVNGAKVRRLVCGSSMATTLRADTGGVIVLAEMLGELLSKPAAFAAAAYLLKRGLGRFCRDAS